MKMIRYLRHHHVLFCVFSTLSLTGAVASQPSQLPCSAWQLHNAACPSPVIPPAAQTSNNPNTTLPTTSNLAVDQAMVALTDDVTVLPPPANQVVAMKVDLRHNEPVPVKAKVKTKPVATKTAYKAAPVKPKLTRSQIVQQELNREKAALRLAENRLQSARKSGQNASVLERQVADRRASISAMQTELSRL